MIWSETVFMCSDIFKKTKHDCRELHLEDLLLVKYQQEEEQVGIGGRGRLWAGKEVPGKQTIR